MVDAIQVDFEAMGREGALLLKDEDRWIHRRVEAIEIGPDPSVRRRLSIDFTVPKSSHQAATGENGSALCYLPLSYIRKRPPLGRFDLMDEAGHPLPLLTLSQNVKADTAALLQLAEQVLGEPPSQALAADISAITLGETYIESARGLIHIVNPPLRLRADDEEHTARRQLAADPRFTDLAGHLIDSTILWVPVHYEPKRRRIVKVSYELATPNRLHPVKAVLTAFGWAAQTYWIETPHVGNESSYHLDISTPPYLRITDVGLETEHDGAVDIRIEGGRAHLYLSGRRSNTAALAWVSLRVERQGFLFSSFMVCSMIALLLAGFRAWPSKLAEAHHLEPTVTIMLLVPGLLAASLASPALMLANRRLLAGTRLMLAAVGAMAVTAAFAPDAWSRSTQLAVWFWSAVATGILATGVLGAVVWPRIKAKDRITL